LLINRTRVLESDFAQLGASDPTEEEMVKNKIIALNDEHKRLQEELRKLREQIEMVKERLRMIQDDDEKFREHRPGYRKVFVTVKEARNLIICDIIDRSSDPFVIIRHLKGDNSEKVKHRTMSVHKNHMCPFWDETMEYRNFEKDDRIEVTIWDEGSLGWDFMGQVTLTRPEIKHGALAWYALGKRTQQMDTLSPTMNRMKKEVSMGVVNLNNIEKMFKDSFMKGRAKVKDQILSRGKTEEITGDICLEFETIE